MLLIDLKRKRLVSILMKFSLIFPLIYVLLSLIFIFVLLVCPTSIKHVVFMNQLKTRTNFSQPESLNLDRVDNFYLDVESNVRLGIWHFRSPLISDRIFPNDDKSFSSTSSKIPILIYFHGNAFDRSLFNRRRMCEKLRDELKFDVFSMDYRGFGDSTGEPTEEGLVKDARALYDFLHHLSDGRRKIYLWGQSLGSAVACQLAARLSDDKSKSLGGIVMEAPFINLHHAFQSHWFASFFRWQPWFIPLIDRALDIASLRFQTRGHLSRLNCHCVLIHADDDETIPYQHSKELLKAAIVAREYHRQKKELLHFQIDMISYHQSRYGHSLIYQDEKLIPSLKRVLFDEHL